MKKWLNIGIIIVLIAAVGYVIIDNLPTKVSENDNKSEQNDQGLEAVRQMQATNFELPLLNGGKMALEDTRGQVTILNFWASWCGPCKDEAPHLQTFYEAHKDDVQFLAVNVTSRDEIKNIEKFVKQFELTFPVLLDESGEVSTMYGAFTIPTTVFLNKDGEIVQEIAGPLNEELLEQIIASIK